MTSVLYKSLICLVFVLVKECQPLKCWTCSSILEPSCEDPFKPKYSANATETNYFLADCEAIFKQYNRSIEEQNLMDQIFGPGAKPYCKKTILTVYSTTIVHRGCSFGDGSKDCAHLRPEECASEACYEDGCNAATSYAYGRVVFLFAPVILMLDLE